jgi:hypothetical protein
LLEAPAAQRVLRRCAAAAHFPKRSSSRSDVRRALAASISIFPVSTFEKDLPLCDT